MHSAQFSNIRTRLHPSLELRYPQGIYGIYKRGRPRFETAGAVTKSVVGGRLYKLPQRIAWYDFAE
jgi:hypothetical protein